MLLDINSRLYTEILLIGKILNKYTVCVYVCMYIYNDTFMFPGISIYLRLHKKPDQQDNILFGNYIKININIKRKLYLDYVSYEKLFIKYKCKINKIE